MEDIISKNRVSIFLRTFNSISTVKPINSGACNFDNFVYNAFFLEKNMKNLNKTIFSNQFTSTGILLKITMHEADKLFGIWDETTKIMYSNPLTLMSFDYLQNTK